MPAISSTLEKLYPTNNACMLYTLFKNLLIHQHNRIELHTVRPNNFVESMQRVKFNNTRPCEIKPGIANAKLSGHNIIVENWFIM